jgi:hypothetical protein
MKPTQGELFQSSKPTWIGWQRLPGHQWKPVVSAATESGATRALLNMPSPRGHQHIGWLILPSNKSPYDRQ